MKSVRKQFRRTGKGLVSEVVADYFKVQGFYLLCQLPIITSCQYYTVRVGGQLNVLQ